MAWMMRRRLLAVAAVEVSLGIALLLALACADSIPSNEYGLNRLFSRRTAAKSTRSTNQQIAPFIRSHSNPTISTFDDAGPLNFLDPQPFPWNLYRPSRKYSSYSATLVSHRVGAGTGSTTTGTGLARSFWPPWPFSMMQQSRYNENSAPSSPVASVAWSWTKSSARFGVRQMQEIGSQLWFHSPPAFPALVVWALIPRRKLSPATTAVAVEGATTASSVTLWANLWRQTEIPLWSNLWVRNAVAAGAGLALLSWANAELQRHARLTPLPLSYPDVNRARLPPFLPEPVSMTTSSPASSDAASLISSSTLRHDSSSTPVAMSRGASYWRWLRHRLTMRKAWAQWQTTQERQHAERANAHRLQVYNELLSMRRAEQTSRRNKKRYDATKKTPSILVSQPKQRWWNLWARWQTSRAAAAQSGPPLGYAVVTGASAGIGRAIAVELARWKIPLILVARDVTALTDLAVDLEACYGVDCCVLSADLSQPSAADKIYETVSQAGLLVDVR
jgi:hypothetical protein